MILRHGLLEARLIASRAGISSRKYLREKLSTRYRFNDSQRRNEILGGQIGNDETTKTRFSVPET
jgi:hypothetical protein